jgi:hypothetical protein
MGANRTPLSTAEKQKIEQLHAAGAGRNEIARELARPWSTITDYCRRSGLSFARTDAALGVEAARRLAAERRAELALALLDDVERLRESMHEPHTMVLYGGKDFVRREETLAEPTPADKRNLAQAAAVLLDRSLRLDEHDRAGGTDGARSVLGQLGDALKLAATPLMPRDPDDDPPS